MTKNITLSAEKSLILMARRRAVSEHKSLNDAFREWLRHYSGSSEPASVGYRRIMKRLSYARSGGPFTRSAMNEH